MKSKANDPIRRSTGLRQRAVAAVRHAPQDVGGLSAEQIRTLVYELQVHQIELEMQNEELRQTQLELEAARDGYRDLYEFAPVGYVTLDATGMIQQANLTAATLLGVDRDRLIGSRLSHFVQASDQDALFLHCRQTFATDARQTCDVGIARSSGEPLWARLETIAIAAKDGNGKSCRMALIDISARKYAEQQQEKLAEQMRQARKMQAIGQLAGGVAHNFNNLLMAISGNVEVITASLSGRDLDGAVTRSHALDQMRKAIGMGMSLTRQFLAFSRKQVLCPCLLDVNQVLADLIDMLRSVLGKRITLKMEAGPDAGCVHADLAQVEQAILNLVLNARDAMPDGGTLTVRTSRDVLNESTAALAGLKPGPHARISITDTGVGMSEATRKHLFEPFFTTKPLGQGTGLGLATVHGFVQQAGGAIEAESRLGHGTTMTILLPSAEVSSGSEAARHARPLPKPAGETILVCEDDPMVRDLLTRYLSASGYTVLEAEDAQHALEVSQGYSGLIRVLVTDLMLTNMDGLSLAETMRGRFEDLRCVLISGHPASVPECDPRYGPGIVFLSKPFQLRDLLQVIQECLSPS